MTRSKSDNKYRNKKPQAESLNNEGDKKTTPKLDSIDEDDQGFGGWLRSPDGLENMKLFVIANSIVLLTTLMFPHIQHVIDFIYDSIYGPDNELIL